MKIHNSVNWTQRFSVLLTAFILSVCFLFVGTQNANAQNNVEFYAEETHNVAVGVKYEPTMHNVYVKLKVKLSRPMTWNGGSTGCVDYNNTTQGYKVISPTEIEFSGVGLAYSGNYPCAHNRLNIYFVKDGQPLDIYLAFLYNNTWYTKNLHLGPEVEPNVGISINDQVLKVGQQITVPVVASNLEGLTGVEGTLTFPTSLKAQKVVTEDTLMKSFFFTPNIQEGRVTFAGYREDPMTFSEGAGVLFNVVFEVVSMGDGDINVIDFYSAPQRNFVTKKGSVAITPIILSGQMLSNNDLLPLIRDVEVMVYGPNNQVTKASVDEIANFYAPIFQIGRHEMRFNYTGESRIGLEDVLKLLECIVDDTIQCPNGDTTGDSEIHIDDVVCVGNFWVGKELDGCKVGLVFEQNPIVFENLREDHSYMRIVGTFFGDVANPEVSSATVETQPVVEFLDNHIITDTVSPIRVKVSSTDLRVAGIILNLSDVELVDVTSTQQIIWQDNRILAFSQNPITEMILTLHVKGSAGGTIKVAEAHTGHTVVPNAAEVVLILGPGPDPIDPMPGLELDTLYLPKLGKQN